MPEFWGERPFRTCAPLLICQLCSDSVVNSARSNNLAYITITPYRFESPLQAGNERKRENLAEVHLSSRDHGPDGVHAAGLLGTSIEEAKEPMRDPRDLCRATIKPLCVLGYKTFRWAKIANLERPGQQTANLAISFADMSSTSVGALPAYEGEKRTKPGSGRRAEPGLYRLRRACDGFRGILEEERGSEHTSPPLWDT
ncbi:hypothetical protein FGG08_001740 [Glutinoglossum americanum]|uniref:Uncharacterized protein n=1 Tax=Glutinoglossum americanum TaxID=1670608 RepID=A0A9P8IE66_9PEZI|nr:hypothetical protein FGG08_001740 [Glutinoglossum americanum]